MGANHRYYSLSSMLGTSLFPYLWWRDITEVERRTADSKVPGSNPGGGMTKKFKYCNIGPYLMDSSDKVCLILTQIKVLSKSVIKKSFTAIMAKGPWLNGYKPPDGIQT